MTRVWFDLPSATIQIDGMPPYPAQSLTVRYDGYVIWATQLNGRDILALPYTELSQNDGSTFANPFDALAYVEAVFLRSIVINCGDI